MVATVCAALLLRLGQGVDKMVSEKKKFDWPHPRQAPSVQEPSAGARQGRGRSNYSFTQVSSPFRWSPSLRFNCSQRILLRLWQSRCYREFGSGLFNVRILEVHVFYLGVNFES